MVVNWGSAVYIYIYIVIFIFIVVFFESTLLLRRPLLKLDIPKIRQGSTIETTWQTKFKI